MRKRASSMGDRAMIVLGYCGFAAAFVFSWALVLGLV